MKLLGEYFERKAGGKEHYAARDACRRISFYHYALEGKPDETLGALQDFYKEFHREITSEREYRKMQGIKEHLPDAVKAIIEHPIVSKAVKAYVELESKKREDERTRTGRERRSAAEVPADFDDKLYEIRKKLEVNKTELKRKTEEVKREMQEVPEAEGVEDKVWEWIAEGDILEKREAALKQAFVNSLNEKGVEESTAELAWSYVRNLEPDEAAYHYYKIRK